jgi:nicotinate-nucleotide adenylyltransferase
MTRRRPVARINRPLDGEPAVRPAPAIRIGLLGGSFNPAHEGHRGISLEALKRLRLHRVWWLVSPQTPLKTTDEMQSYAARFASARRIADHPRLVVSDLERRLDTRYTVDTLKRLTERRGHRFVWLLGADNLAQLPRWHRWRQLVRLAPIAVFDRQPYSYPAMVGQVATAHAGRRKPERAAAKLAEAHPPAWVYLRQRRYPVSSTEIRRDRATTGRRAGHEERAT